MNPLSSAQIAALRELRSIWPEEKLVIIGATALAFFIEMDWRETRDLDLTISVGMSAFPGELASRSDWARDPKREHRWGGPGGVVVDLLPVGPGEISRGVLVWPPTGSRMNVRCFSLAFSEAVAVRLRRGLSIDVAPPWVVVLLKMVAYLDRPADRGRDLADIAFSMDRLFGPADDERYGDAVLSRDLTYDQVSPFLVGRRLGRLLDRETRELVDRFSAMVRDEGDPHATQARLLAAGPVGWRNPPSEMMACLEAFQLGLDAES
jgi:predicted nucleotidyltransferase